jgi:transposase InsO family protein
MATQYGRYGYRQITVLLKREGWQVNHKRVERLWRREGLKVPQKQPKRKRFGSMIVPVSGCDPSLRTMYGDMTLWPLALMTGGQLRC